MHRHAFWARDLCHFPSLPHLLACLRYYSHRNGAVGAEALAPGRYQPAKRAPLDDRYIRQLVFSQRKHLFIAGGFAQSLKWPQISRRMLHAQRVHPAAALMWAGAALLFLI